MGPSSDASDQDVAPVVVDDAGTVKEASAPDTNPDGIPYPTDYIGTRARNGLVSGNRIANFKFVGYPKGDGTKGLQPISLAQFFDPTHKRYRLLHILAGAKWDSATKAEADVLTSMSASLEQQEVACLISLAEGATVGTPSTEKDLQAFIADVKAPFTQVLDPSSGNFSPFFDVPSFPLSSYIDTRTMEILTGATVTADGIQLEITDALKLAAESKL